MPTPLTQCCPPPDVGDTSGPSMALTYVFPDGTFWNTYTNMTTTLLTYGYVDPGTGHIYTPSEVFGKCIRTQAAPAGFGKPYDAIPCPCCPDGYTYKNYSKICEGSSSRDLKDPVACIVCACEDPPPPPQCEGCVNPSLPIVFTLDESSKRCVDCDPNESPRGTSDARFNAFMSNFLVDPIVIFKLKQ